MKTINNTELMLKENISKLIEELKTGHTEGFQKYLTFCSQFHSYSFNNRMLIAIQCPIATHVAGYQSWRKLGRQVKEGEKSIKILMPLIGNKKDKDGKKTSETFLYGYKETSVFDISQTTGEEIPNDCTIIAGNDFKNQYMNLVQVMNNNNIKVSEVDLGDSCTLRGRSFGGRVEVNQHLSFNHKLKTLIHEFAHERLHQGSESDNLVLSRDLREFEAESTAYVVCLMLGLEATTSKDYILNWIGSKDFEATKFSANLDRVLKTSSFIFEQFLNIEQDAQLINQEDQLMAA
jgi:hypothetical protein